jgi:20S proteasome alpha/beta subunit
MTLLVGILSEGGVVLAADSAATFGALGQRTIIQTTVKVEIVRGEALIATSGPVGMSQRLVAELEEVFENNKLAGVKRSAKAMAVLRTVFMQHIAAELQAAQIAAPVVGLQVAQNSALQHTLVAMCFDGRPRLYQFDHQGAPEESTENLPFVCAGGGQANADPFLAFLKGLFWEDGKLPTLPQAIFSALWTVQQSIDVSPGGLGEPVRMYVLRKEESRCAAEQLGDEDFQEAQEAIAAARGALKDFQRMDREAPDVPSR